MKITGNAEKEVLDFLNAWAPAPGSVRRLKGDASTRRYYRLSGFGLDRAVLMYVGGPFGETESAFLGIRSYLSEIGVPVPRMLEQFPEKGMMLLEDLGDLSLRDFLETSDQERRRVMIDSVEILVRMQTDGTTGLGPHCPAYFVRFDGEIFYRELRFFHENFLVKVTETPAALEGELDDFYRQLAEALATYSDVFCHRDFHVDNLYFHREKVYVIDFQDARVGPPAYDLASLLTDRNMRGILGEALLEALFDHYVTRMDMDRREFEHQYGLAAAQRCLKATGTFGYQYFTRGNESYGRYIAPTLGEFQRAAATLKRFSKTGESLLQIIPDRWKEPGPEKTG